VRILFVHEVNYETKPIYEIQEFPESLALLGHDVHFLMFEEGYKFWKGLRKAGPRRIGGRVMASAELTLHVPVQMGIPGLDRVLSIFTVVPKLFQLLSRFKFDVVVNYAVPTFGPQVNFMAKRFRVPTVFRALDVSNKIRKTFASGFVSLAEKITYASSSLISSHNEVLASYCKNISRQQVQAVVNLPPVDLSHFKPLAPSSNLRDELGITADENIILFLGTFYNFSGLEELVQVFGNFRAPRTKLLLIGNGELETTLRQLVNARNLQENVIFAGFVDYSRLPEYFSVAKVAVNTFEKGLITDCALPQKVLQYCAAGLPILSTNLAGLQSVFGDMSGIIWADDIACLMEKAIQIIQNDEEAKALSIRNRQFALEHFELNLAVKDFESTLMSLVLGGAF
jgi:glycosyltransferase involved in cell wall biosynthesis